LENHRIKNREEKNMTSTNNTRWHAKGKFPTGVFINNSLTNSRDELSTVERNHVKFYICGPTVYNSSHLGHARAYLTFDIIRGILEDFFSLDVSYVMNITDIDDKIILRGRQAHLIEKWMQEHPTLDANVVADLTASVEQAKVKLQEKIKEFAEPKDEEARNMKALYEKQLAGEQAILVDLIANESADAITKLCEKHSTIKDNLGVWLDGKYGKGTFDNEIFMKFARYYEQEFMQDMQDLGVRPPTVMTRISEYVPEVVSYVERIIANGYGYVAEDGSVYFDTEAFKTAGHCYRKLVPPAKDADDSKLLAEGEGALASDGPSLKKCPNDFVLWKTSKPGEPVWTSPWGEGRPGWHIECSAMASAVFDDNMDMHGGGVDLKFPHHDNELAQGEAHYGCHQMVNNFLHAGHLHIEGLKMSKSLKNFTTIREGLKNYTPNQIRMLFLLNSWDKPMNFSEKQLQESAAKEKQFHEFFQNLKMILRDQSALPVKKWGRSTAAEQKQKEGETKSSTATHTEYDLWCALVDCRKSVDERLRDNFDTNTSLRALCDLVTFTNKYLSFNKAKEQGYLLLDVGKYIAKVLTAFGVIKRDFGSWLIANDSQSLMVQLNTLSSNESDANGGNREAIVTPLVKIVSDMRDQLRQLAGAGAGKKELFDLCDSVREQLAYEGVRLEDRPGQSTGWKFEDAKLLRAAIEAEKKEKAAKKKKKKDKPPAAPAAPVCDPVLMYKPDGPNGKDKEGAVMYSQWNEETGIPTHLLDGSEVSKKKQKKLVKAQATLAKKFKAQQNA
jgi:cysteinyl-tRNA synthetase